MLKIALNWRFSAKLIEFCVFNWRTIIFYRSVMSQIKDLILGSAFMFMRCSISLTNALNLENLLQFHIPNSFLDSFKFSCNNRPKSWKLPQNALRVRLQTSAWPSPRRHRNRVRGRSKFKALFLWREVSPTHTCARLQHERKKKSGYKAPAHAKLRPRRASCTCPRWYPRSSVICAPLKCLRSIIHNLLGPQTLRLEG